MFKLNPFRRCTRQYSNRLPPQLARRALVSIRVHEDVRLSIRKLAEERGMSVSEYVCRVLNDHLRIASGQVDDGRINRTFGGLS